MAGPLEHSAKGVSGKNRKKKEDSDAWGSAQGECVTRLKKLEGKGKEGNASVESKDRWFIKRK